jgi:hypothetical protein
MRSELRAQRSAEMYDFDEETKLAYLQEADLESAVW